MKTSDIEYYDSQYAAERTINYQSDSARYKMKFFRLLITSLTLQDTK